MIALTVNEQRRLVDAAPGSTLASVLREQLGATSVKLGCERGECGTCTVLVDGRPRAACITLAELVDGPVTSAEGLMAESQRLRAELADRGGFQCGFCTAGIVVRACALLREPLPDDPHAARTRVRAELSGNICRCTGYSAIVDAICAEADRRRAERR